MTERVFQGHYAELYDQFYRDKDYEAECDLLEEVFRRYGNGSVRSILDLGCGTGNHAFPLARRGYRVTGVDRSLEMLAGARQKAEFFPKGPSGHLPAFHQGDVRTFALGRKFDAVLMMFAVLSYQLSNEEVLAALAGVRRHLCPGGLFVADVWYGPAVLALRPGDRLKVIATTEGQILRATSASLDTFRQVCEVNYRVWQLAGDRLVRATQESHHVRYFFPQELFLFLSLNALEPLIVSAFPDLSRSPSEDTWNVLVVGRSGPEATA
ncbi:MAG: class I SAM-dependent methyltransferase [Desulfobaccales bacterium]